MSPALGKYTRKPSRSYPTRGLKTCASSLPNWSGSLAKYVISLFGHPVTSSLLPRLLSFALLSFCGGLIPFLSPDCRSTERVLFIHMAPTLRIHAVILVIGRNGKILRCVILLLLLHFPSSKSKRVPEGAHHMLQCNCLLLVHAHSSLLLIVHISPLNYWPLPFQVNHGNEETFRDMLRVKRTVQTAFSQVAVQGVGGCWGTEGNSTGRIREQNTFTGKMIPVLLFPCPLSFCSSYLFESFAG